MTEPIVLKDLEGAECASLLALFRRAFGPWSADRLARLWDWQYRLNPYGAARRPVIRVGLCGERVVAFLGAFPVPLRLGERREVAVCGSGFAVDRNFRGAGLRLAEEFARRPPAMGTGLSEPSRRLFARFGASVLPASRARFVYRLRRTGAACRAVRRRVPPGLRWIASPRVLGRLASRSRKVARLSAATSRDRFEVRPIVRFDREYDALWVRASAHWTFSIDKTSTYMNWRYLDCPGTHPICLGLYDRADALVGAAVAVTYARRDGASEPCGTDGEIVELIAGGAGQEDAAAHLASAALAALDRERVDVVGVTGMRPALHPVLRELGFVAGESDLFAMFLRPGRTGHEAAHAGDGWYVTAGDGDALFVPAL